MNPKLRIHKLIAFWMCSLPVYISVLAQVGASTFKEQIALGVNSSSSNGFVDNFEEKYLNFPTVNLGLQCMFTKNFGGKLNYGFSRISNKKNTAAFKLNYSRVNLQLVYDASQIISFTNRMGTLLHAGPGCNFVKPLGNFTNNDV